MKQSVRLGRIRGITIGAHWSVGLILVIIAEVLAASVLPAAYPHERPVVYWSVAIVTAVLFLASLLAHELAHALVASRSGVKVRSIALWMLGGMTEFDGEPPTAGADFRIAVAGPLTSLAAGALCYGVAAAIHAAGGPRIVVAAAMWLALMNFVLGVFNLLPGAPLDGGRVLRAALWRRYGDRESAERGSAVVGQVLGAVIVGLGFVEALTYNVLDGVWLALIGWFLITAATAERQTANAEIALNGVQVAEVMTPHPDVASGWHSVADFNDEAARSRQDAFPVVDFDGQLTGVVLTSQLTRVPAGQRSGLRVDQVMLPVPPAYRAAPGDPAAPLASRMPLGGQVAAVVLADGQVTGLVTGSDLDQAMRRRKLTTSGR